VPPEYIGAAGGVPWRREGGKLLLAVVHRARYDDWSFPKGKLRYGEQPLLAAVREVTEETGLALVVGRRLPRTSYLSVEGPKSVDYWSMQANGAFAANDETDDLEWLTPQKTMDRLSYDGDRALVEDLLSAPVEPVRVLLVRHARAGDSDQWPGADRDRPLDELGVAEARALAEVLPVFGPTRVVTAEPVRCRQTLQPLAERLGLPVGPATEFGEDGYADAPAAARESLLEMLSGDGVTAISSQGGVVPELLNWLLSAGPPVTGVSPRRRANRPPARKGSAWALTARDGSAVSADYYASFLA
jgi:8-oxo-dGTP diphosphatase